MAKTLNKAMQILLELLIAEEEDLQGYKMPIYAAGYPLLKKGYVEKACYDELQIKLTESGRAKAKEIKISSEGQEYLAILDLE